MSGARVSGFSTIEAMVALVVFAVGVLGAAGTMAVAWRAEMAGERAATVSRLAGTVLDSLRNEVIHGEGRCDRLSGGLDSGRHDTSARWNTMVSPGGREIWLAVSFISLRTQASDTVWTFLPCR